MQMIRKILLAAGAAALMSTPAWALPTQTPSNGGTEHAPATTPVGPPSTTPNNTNNPGSANRHSGKASGTGHKGSGDSGSKGNSGAQHGNSGTTHGKSHKCVAHRVGYVASGTLVSQTLTKNADGTYSGEVVVEVTHTNHHAAADKGKTVSYTVEKVHVTFGLADTNSDGSVGVDDLAKGDRTHLNGKITTLAKKCDQTEFKATTTIRKIVFHAPATEAPKA
jgi:hypothetical protein